MWWRVVRIFSYLICIAVIVMFVVSQWYYFDLAVRLGAETGAGFGWQCGNAVIGWWDYDVPGNYIDDRWVGLQVISADQFPALRAWIPVIESYDHRPMAGPKLQLVSVADVYPLTLACLGLALTYFITWRARRRPGPGHCSKCGYDLRGNPAATTCPECGKAIENTTPANA